MELIFKASAAALIAAAIGLIIKKSNPEISLLLGGCTAAVILLSSMDFMEGIGEIAEILKKLSGGSETLIRPVLKCLAVAIVTKLSADLCRDSSQAAAASALELAGTVCAMSISLPLILNVLRMIGGFV